MGLLVAVGPFLVVCRVLLAIPVVGAQPVGAVAATVRAVRLARGDHLTTVAHMGMVAVVSAPAWLPSWTTRSLFAGGPAVVAGSVAAVVLETLLAPLQVVLLACCYTHLCRRAGVPVSGRCRCQRPSRWCPSGWCPSGGVASPRPAGRPRDGAGGIAAGGALRCSPPR
ncbi:hypothetical protein [Sphaerisporangium rhizosphaerae]|uniref:ComEC/Rec2-related protein domain-containing protein n=1 Tax=Sphaerisporangium rhizosphaerae TaxID=2269375 RepID=A0ABW2NT56_9ACTN